MNKNIQIILGVLGALIIGIAIYLATRGGDKTLINFSDGGTQKSAVSVSQNNKSVSSPSGTGSMPAAPTKPTTFLCKDGKTIAFSHPKAGLVVTLTDSAGKRDIAMTLNAKKSKVNPTFQNQDGSVVFVSKGPTSVVEEKGNATFTGCSISK